MFDGLGDGTAVADALWDGDGEAVGAGVGATVGRGVGATVGLGVGTGVGLGVGAGAEAVLACMKSSVYMRMLRTLPPQLTPSAP